ncbi:MAG: YfhO family protein [Actinomycetota bacterium]|nr:YfhO family protein [Actinomycetota bacterium]
MVLFGFEPIESSRGRRFQYSVECPTCFTELEPQLVTGHDINDKGNLLLRGRLVKDHLAAFAPLYERLAPVSPSRTAVRGRQDAPGRWTIETSGPQPALVVVSEAYFPGWRAEVDGRRLPVALADGAFVGIPVDAGDHRITLVYQAPAAAWLGRAITILTLLAIAAGALRSRRRNRRHALEVRAPARQSSGEEVLGAREGLPGPTVGGRESPGGEGDEAVLAAVDDLQPGRFEGGEKSGGGEP